MTPQEKKEETAGKRAGGTRTIREDAEEQLLRSTERSPGLEGQSKEELIQELRVHQVELEMQAEQLRVAQLALEESRDWYIDLYEFAPTGYLTFTDKALITVVNLTAAVLLGVERNDLVNHGFGRFIDPGDDEVWDQYFIDLLNKGKKQSCILTLVRGDGSTFPARLEGVRTSSPGGAVTVRIAISDITDIWQIGALRESEEHYHAIFDQSPIAIELYDAAGTLVHINQAGLDLFGIESMQVIRNFSLFSDPNITHEQKEKLHLGEMVRYQGPFDFEKVKTLGLYPTIRGGIIWLDVRITPLKNHGNSVSGFLVQIQDITVRISTEKDLHESEIKHRALFEAIADTVFLIDQQTGSIIDVNPAASLTYGYDHDEFIRMNAVEVSVEPEQTARALDKPLSHIPLRYHHRKDGSVFPVELTASTFELNGRTTIIAAARDITDRIEYQDTLHASEVRYHRLFETAQDGIIILDEETGKIIDVNTFLLEMLGYPLEYFIGRHLWELGFIKDKTIAQNAFTELKTKGYIRYEDLPLETKDGRSMDVEFISNVYLVGDKKIIQCNIRDITARKRVENALALASRKLNLLSSITRHDINNQLMTVNGFLDIVHQKVRDPALKDYFTRIEKASSRISAMIRFTKEYEDIGVNAPIWQDCRTLVGTATKQAPLGTVQVKNDLPAGLEVLADPLIVKVFYNLMDNAARYGGKITNIRFSAIDRDDTKVLVCEDDGDGIPPNEKEKIFERGFGKNTGLGLAISLEILAITGITIRENGEPGKGARFEITVPNGAWGITEKNA